MYASSDRSRRAFLSYVAGSPLLGLLGISACSGRSGDDVADLLASLITSADDALNVFDFQAVARQTLPPAHYGYLATGVDGDETLRANREGFQRFDLRARRLVNVSEIDMGIDLFGLHWDTPIVLSPVGSQKAFHEEGELGVAIASNAAGHHQILSTVTTTSIEDVNAARSRPVWYQLYPTSSWSVAETLIRRAENAGCEALVLTVDLPVGSNRETLYRAMRTDTRDCAPCHDRPLAVRKPMFESLDLTDVPFETPWMTWDFVGKLRDTTDMKILIKGIVRDDDAKRCLEYGVDGIIVSNHGGRADASGRSTIESLPEIVNVVDHQIPVLIDSGFRRGSDIFKALALGADAICIGRPYIWGLAAFGQAGVTKVLQILRAELHREMQLHGVASISEIDESFVIQA